MNIFICQKSGSNKVTHLTKWKEFQKRINTNDKQTGINVNLYMYEYVQNT